MKTRLDYYINHPIRLTGLALNAALACHERGEALNTETVQVLKMAHSLVNEGSVTVDELQPILGDNWAITRRRDRANPITYRQYEDAQIAALATRLGMAERFVRSKLTWCQKQAQAERKNGRTTAI